MSPSNEGNARGAMILSQTQRIQSYGMGRLTAIATNMVG